MRKLLYLPDWREEARYGIYTVRLCSECGGTGLHVLDDGLGPDAKYQCASCRGNGYELVLLATAEDPGGVGQALVQQGLDRIEAGLPTEGMGVLDGYEHRWLAHPPWRART